MTGAMWRVYVAIVCVIGFAGAVNASGIDPLFLLDTGPTFQAALDDGRIAAIALYSDISDFYPGRAGDFVVPPLSVIGGTLSADFGTGTAPLGGWTYTYPSDPDLNGLNLSYTADPGANTQFSILLTTDDFKIKRFRFTGPAGGGNMPLNFPAGATDPGSIGASSIETGTGFRLSHVVRIFYVWDGQRNLLSSSEMNVSPEPACLPLLAGAVVLIRRRRPGSKSS